MGRRRFRNVDLALQNIANKICIEAEQLQNIVRSRIQTRKFPLSHFIRFIMMCARLSETIRHFFVRQNTFTMLAYQLLSK